MTDTIDYLAVLLRTKFDSYKGVAHLLSAQEVITHTERLASELNSTVLKELAEEMRRDG